MTRPAPRVDIGAGSIERAASSARPATLFAERLEAFKAANALFITTCDVPGGATDEVAEDLCEKAGDAYFDMVTTPAPDAAAFVQKFGAVDAWNDGVAPKQDTADALYADVRALMGESEVSRG